MINVLSIDGGGIRGLIPAVVLSDLEDRTGTPTADLFDLIAGTSTGGILALGLTVPDDTPNGASESLSPKYSAEALADLYRKRGSDIFQRSVARKITSGLHYIDEKYPADGLEKVLDEYFGDEPIDSALTDVTASTYDLQNREPYFFKSWRERDQDVFMRSAARATSAAPTYFEPAQVTIEDSQHVLVDGGVYVNNPAVSAFAEAKKHYEDDEIRVVAIGTGRTSSPISYEDAKDWGLVEWGIRIYDIASDGVSNAADYQLEHVLGDRFYRLQVPLRHASDAMDDASPQNLQALEEDARALTEVKGDELDHIATQLTR